MKREPLAGILVVLALVGAAKWFAKKPQTADPAAKVMRADRQPGNAMPSDLHYWSFLGDILTRMPTGQDTPPAQFVRGLRDAAVRIRSTPVVGIDDGLVRYGLQLADFLALFAQHVESSGDPWIFIEAFERGRRGDPLGVALERRQIEQGLQAEVFRLQQEGFRLRAALSVKHRIEFPMPAF